MNPNFNNIIKGRYLPIICTKYLSTGSKFLKNHKPLLYIQSNVTEISKPNLQFIRNKYKKQSRRMEEESDSESDDDDGIPERGTKTVNVKVTSLRTDLIIKSGLAIARNKVETIFYDSRIRVNGKKILKKSQRVNIGDEIDVIRSVSPMNPNFLIVSRIGILSAKGEEDGIRVKLQRTKTLTVENYTEPWKESSGDTNVYLWIESSTAYIEIGWRQKVAASHDEDKVNIGDEIDVIRSVSPMNSNFLIVSRIEILSAKGEEDGIRVKLQRTKTLTVENYTEPWKESSGDTNVYLWIESSTAYIEIGWRQKVAASHDEDKVNIGDEIDVIRSVSPMNPNFLIVSRIGILSAKGEEDGIRVKLQRTKTLTVENYTEPWKESSGDS